MKYGKLQYLVWKHEGFARAHAQCAHCKWRSGTPCEGRWRPTWSWKASFHSNIVPPYYYRLLCTARIAALERLLRNNGPGDGRKLLGTYNLHSTWTTSNQISRRGTSILAQKGSFCPEIGRTRFAVEKTKARFEHFCRSLPCPDDMCRRNRLANACSKFLL
jgi:hypothetical protein